MITQISHATIRNYRLFMIMKLQITAFNYIYYIYIGNDYPNILCDHPQSATIFYLRSEMCDNLPITFKMLSICTYAHMISSR